MAIERIRAARARMKRAKLVRAPNKLRVTRLASYSWLPALTWSETQIKLLNAFRF